MSSPSRPPVPLDKLRKQSSAGLEGARAHEYSIKSWLAACKDSFERAVAAWKEGRGPGGDPAKVEEAFVQQRRGAELLRLVMIHPQHKDMNPADKAALRRVQELLLETSKDGVEIKQRLEQREKDWISRYGPITSTANARQGSANGVRADGSMGQTASPRSLNQASLAPSTSKTAPTSAQSHSTSPPLDSLQARMAALRAHGVAGTTAGRPSGPRPMAAPPAVYKPPPSSAADSDGHVTHAHDFYKSAASAGARGDLVEDSAVQRSGSAPPVIPLTDGDGNHGFESLGSQLAAEGTSEHRNDTAARYNDLASLPSPTDFNVTFPSLDDFERSVPADRTEGFELPSVPTSPPSAKAEHRSLPPPPRPFEMDARDFDRQQQAHTQAVMTLGGPPNPAGPSPHTRNDIPASLKPGQQAARASSIPSTSRPSNASATRPRVPPPTGSSIKTFNLPPTAEIAPVQFYGYLSSSQAQKGDGPRVLLLDVRSREEFERGRIMGETVCLEPVVLRPGITSTQLESALSLSPQHELDMFSARHNYDMVVIYDRSSLSMPGSEPISTAPEAQRVLWNLTNAIYEREFYKSLKRQPVLLKGGWEAWNMYVGAKGVVTDREDASRTGHAVQQTDVDEFGRLEGRKLPAKASNGMTSPSASRQEPSEYFPSGSSYTGPSPQNNMLASNGIISPRLAMPPTAAQRSGSIPSYDAFSSNTFVPNYPQHAPQPSINGLNPSNGNSAAYTSRPRSDFGDLHVQSRQSFEDFSPRPSIDYPQIQHRPPQVAYENRPPALPPAPLARPPPVQPAPKRANSSFSGLQVGAYPASRSAFPTNVNFDDQAIGLTGLKNLGNTCYMNSTIQCLSATIPFARYFKDRSYRRDINTVNPLGTKGALADAVSELLRAIWAQQYTFLSPVTFRENICRVAPQFRGSDQHDAQEFLGFLLDGLHEDLNYVLKKPPPIEMTPDREHDLETLPQQVMSEREWEIYRMRNDSFVVQCFQGQFRNQLKCLTCNKTSTTYNTFMPLSIPIPSGRGLTKASLDDCIRAFVREEIMDKEDAWYCPNCKTNRRAIKKLTLSRLPPILVIHLKRFSFHGPFSDKIETQIQYPLSGLDLTHYLPPPLMDQRNPQNSNTKSSKLYDLFAVTNHYGNLSSGHYTAFVRSGRDWHNIGDSKCTQVDPRVVESAKSAYILYYALR